MMMRKTDEGTADFSSAEQDGVRKNVGTVAGEFWLGLAKLGKLSKFCKFLAGSFSAVSKRNFVRKYAFDNIFQTLQYLHTSAPLQTQHFSKMDLINQ